MTSTAAADRKPWFKRWWVWVVGVVGVLIVVSVVANLAGVEPTRSEQPAAGSASAVAPTAAVPTVAPSGEASPTPTALPDAERLEAVRLALADSYGGQEPSEVFASDSSLWYGYLTDLRVERANLYATLQISPGDPEADNLADRAARALTQLLPVRQANGIDYVIIEDASGTVITQESTPAL